MNISNNKTDFYTSVLKALEEIDQKFMEYPGLIVTGSHDPMDVEENILKLKKAREEGIPTLGICMGMQLMAIEWVRSMQFTGSIANSVEINPTTPEPVIIQLHELRVGIRPVRWDGKTRMESHWHNYYLNPEYVGYFKEHWIVSDTDKITEVILLREHPFYVGIQFHPEYQSSKDNPHPLLKQFIKACKEKHIAELHQASER